MPTAVLGEVGDRAMQWYWSRSAKGKAGVGCKASLLFVSERIDIPGEDRTYLSSKEKTKDMG